MFLLVRKAENLIWLEMQILFELQMSQCTEKCASVLLERHLLKALATNLGLLLLFHSALYSFITAGYRQPCVHFYYSQHTNIGRSAVTRRLLELEEWRAQWI